MADLGADVLKVEDTGMGDYVRWAEPRLRGRGALGGLVAVPRAEPGQALRAREPQGRGRARRCSSAWCASTTCCWSPSAPACSTAWAWATSVLREENPGLVYCAITGYGQDGPYRDRSGHDMNYLGLNGLLGLTGETDGPPDPGRGPDRRPRRRRADGARSGSWPRCASATARARASSWTSRCTTARCRGWRWWPAATCATASSRGAAASSWPARWSVTGPTRAPTAGSPSARWSRSSGRPGVAGWGART